MSTTHKYNFIFIIPNALSGVPIPFEQFAKHDEDGNTIGYYTYDEYMSLDGNKAVLTPKGGHSMISVNATSIMDLAVKFPQYISSVSQTTEIVEGINTDRWLDAVQDDYLWIITTEPTASDYNYDAFIKVSPLFV